MVEEACPYFSHANDRLLARVYQRVTLQVLNSLSRGFFSIIHYHSQYGGGKFEDVFI